MNSFCLIVKNNIESILLFAFPLFFLTIKSYSNTILVLIFLYSVIKISFNHKLFLKNRDSKFWLLFISITLPFSAELIVQILREDFNINALDGPVRFLAGGVMFIYFSKCDLLPKHFHYFSLGCFISIFVTFFVTLFFKEHYWGSRIASYFSDPNTIAVYSVVLFFGSFFYVSRLNSIQLQLLAHSTLLFSTIYLIIGSGTRTSWISFLIALILKLFLVDKKYNYLFLYSLFFVAIIPSLLLLSPDIYEYFLSRCSKTFDSINSYLNGYSTNTAIGIRLNLILIDIELIKNHLWLGIPDGTLPSFESLNSSLPTITEIDYHTRLFSGSHVEMLAQMARKGFILGLLSSLSLFVLPLIISFRSAFYTKHKNLIMCTALLVTLSLLISSFGIQVFPLKMTSSFWAFFLVLIYSNYYQMSGSPNQNS